MGVIVGVIVIVLLTSVGVVMALPCMPGVRCTVHGRLQWVAEADGAGTQ